MLIDKFGHLEHADLLFAVEDRLKLIVTVDHAPILRVLQVILLYIGPYFSGYLRARQRLITDDGTQRGIGLHGLHKRSVELIFSSFFLSGSLYGLTLLDRFILRRTKYCRSLIKQLI